MCNRAAQAEGKNASIVLCKVTTRQKKEQERLVQQNFAVQQGAASVVQPCAATSTSNPPLGEHPSEQGEDEQAT